MSKLSPAQIRDQMNHLPEWRRRARVISRIYKFDDFGQAMKFVNRVARLAEKADHHPDIDIRYNKVALHLTTHDKGGLTTKDFHLAEQCDRLTGR